MKNQTKKLAKLNGKGRLKKSQTKTIQLHSPISTFIFKKFFVGKVSCVYERIAFMKQNNKASEKKNLNKI